MPLGEHREALLVRQEDVRRHDHGADWLCEPPLHLAVRGRQVGGQLQRDLQPRVLVAEQAEVVPHLPAVDLGLALALQDERYADHQLRGADASKAEPAQGRRVELAVGARGRRQQDAVDAEVGRPMKLLLQSLATVVTLTGSLGGIRVEPAREGADDRRAPRLAVQREVGVRGRPELVRPFARHRLLWSLAERDHHKVELRL
mmetsp:Transcript_17725/g.46752  ORF Transcript_17725/g.46752 Transcript_17725/m.46752 type:complete len:202 (-) Transcript_17725:220-825(-)